MKLTAANVGPKTRQQIADWLRKEGYDPNDIAAVTPKGDNRYELEVYDRNEKGNRFFAAPDQIAYHVEQFTATTPLELWP
jgi:hypothetical protein